MKVNQQVITKITLELSEDDVSMLREICFYDMSIPEAMYPTSAKQDGEFVNTLSKRNKVAKFLNDLNTALLGVEVK